MMKQTFFNQIAFSGATAHALQKYTKAKMNGADMVETAEIVRKYSASMSRPEFRKLGITH